MARYVKFFGLGGGTDGFITGSCNDIQVTSYLQANGPEANINVAIIPKGTGAIVASCPDGTATGGNARGTYAVDLSPIRVTGSEVASGNFSVIAGGYRATASGQSSVVSGGSQNKASGYISVVGGGSTNNATNSYSAVFSGLGNNATSEYSTISGGYVNTASTNAYATVVGGQSNTSSGLHSISGGLGSTASGQRGIALGGYSTASGGFSLAIGDANTASGTKSVVLGADSRATQTASVAIGNVVYSEAENSFVTGNRTLGYLYGQNANASGRFTGNGDAQQSLLTARKSDTLASASTTVLSLDGTGTTNLIIPDGTNRLWSAKITATAFVSAVSGTTLVLGDSYMAEYTVLFKKVGGVSSVVGTNAGSVIADTNMISSAFTFSAGASQELAITFKAPTTANADTFRCVAKVELVEVAY